MLKEGVADDAGNRERIAKLLRFASTKSETDEQTVSLSEYVGRMKDGQDAIYYITADSYPAARNSPHLEIFRKLGVEVLLMYDRVDEWVVSLLTEFDGKPLQSVAKGGLDLSKLGGDARSRSQDRRAPGARRPHARRPRGPRERGPRHQPADRLAVVSGQRRARHEHASRAPAQGSRPARARLEADPGDQPAASDRAAAEGRDRRRRFSDWSHILFDQALLAEGGQLDDPASFVKRLNEVMLALAGGARGSGRPESVASMLS